MINPNSLCPGCMNEKVTEGKCPICGYNPEEPQNPMYLAPNSVFEDRYVIGKAVDVNGEGVTYLGFDTVTSTAVNIREYFPSGLCERDSDGSVIMVSGSEFSYNEGLLKFIELSKELFKLNELPALYDVLDVREANNTAYRITRAVPGITLREFLMRNGGILKWDQARSLFAPLVSSISALHKAGILHRGISPDTLIVGKDGKLRLSGFCIDDVRTAKSAFTSQLFPGFAAVEQYGGAGTEGTWTDVYAFAATIYRTLVGNPPPEATERLENDNMTIPAKIARETPKAVLETLANALQVLPADRTPYIDDMKKGLSVSSAQTAVSGSTGARSAAASGYVTSDDEDEQKPRRSSGKKKGKLSTTKMYGLVAFIATVFLLAAIIVFVLWTMGIIGGSSGSSASDGADSSLPSMEAPSLESPSSMEFENEVEALPDFKGQSYADIVIDPDFVDIVKFKIVSKEYSDTVPEGQVISQSPEAGTTVEVGKTTVELVVSAGPYYISMPDVSGLDQDSAMLTLLKAGFKAKNISVSYKYDTSKAPGVVIQTDPERGMSVNTEMKVDIIMNSYMGEPVDEDDPDTEQ